MDDKFNTIAGWTLAGCVAALGLSIASGMAFKSERPAKMGYPIEGVEEAGAGGAAAEEPIAARLAVADVAKGQASFAKCAACHTINSGGANGIGPNLHGVVGEELAAAKHNFAFSPALKAKGGSWTFEALDAWLKSPRKFADGTKMTFAGLGNAQERANLIAYLNTEGSNLSLPAAPAAGEAPTPDSVEGKEGTETIANTGDIANAATPASGAPSVDPAAASEAAKHGELPQKK